MRFYGLTAGAHTVELRSADLSLIWARGTLNLQRIRDALQALP